MIGLLILLLIYGGIIFGLVVAFRKIGVARRAALFAGFTLFGIVSGLLAALCGPGEVVTLINMPGVQLGYEVYNYSTSHFGDPHSSFAHFTIPWVLRIPQVFLFTSAIVWGLLGLLAQLVYNAVRRAVPATKGIGMLVMLALFIACLGVSAGIVYATQGEYERQAPVQPTAFPVVKASTSPPPQWEAITTWKVESLTLSSEVIKVGYELEVTGVVKNTGSKKGMAEVEIEVDGKVLSSQEVALLPGESKLVTFVIFVPRQGTYTVRMGNQTERFRAVAPEGGEL